MSQLSYTLNRILHIFCNVIKLTGSMSSLQQPSALTLKFWNSILLVSRDGPWAQSCLHEGTCCHSFKLHCTCGRGLGIQYGQVHFGFPEAAESNSIIHKMGKHSSTIDTVLRQAGNVKLKSDTSKKMQKKGTNESGKSTQRVRVRECEHVVVPAAAYFMSQTITSVITADNNTRWL